MDGAIAVSKDMALPPPPPRWWGSNCRPERPNDEYGWCLWQRAHTRCWYWSRFRSGSYCVWRKHGFWSARAPPRHIPLQHWWGDSLTSAPRRATERPPYPWGDQRPPYPCPPDEAPPAHLMAILDQQVPEAAGQPTDPASPEVAEVAEPRRVRARSVPLSSTSSSSTLSTASIDMDEL